MRAIWTGSLSFGLINVPVKLYSGSESRGGIELNMLHKKDLSPIRYAKFCRKENKEITFGEVVKGYEYEPGEFIVLEDEDLEKANAEKTSTIEIAQFSDEDEIDIRYFEKPYYLEPMKGAEKTYALLQQALKKSGKIAIARFVLRNREHLAAVKPVGPALVLNQMRFPEEIRSPGGLKLPDAKAADVKKAELDMALKLISQLTDQFIPEDFHDTYTAELEKVIAEKVKGRKPKKRGKQPAATETTDLMAALKASLGETEDEDRPAPIRRGGRGAKNAAKKTAKSRK